MQQCSCKHLRDLSTGLSDNNQKQYLVCCCCKLDWFRYFLTTIFTICILLNKKIKLFSWVLYKSWSSPVGGSEIVSGNFELLALASTPGKYYLKFAAGKSDTPFSKISYTFIGKCSLHNSNLSEETAAICRVMVIHSWDHPYWVCIEYDQWQESAGLQ